MWQRSVLDEASQDTTCLRFVAHKHCQYVLTSYHNSSDVLSGGGRVRISGERRMAEILLTIFSCGLATSCLHLQPTAGDGGTQRQAPPPRAPGVTSGGCLGSRFRCTSERLSGGGSGAQSADENDSDSSDDESEEEYDAD